MIIGTHIDDYIGDSAVTVDLSGNNEGLAGALRDFPVLREIWVGFPS